MQFPQPQHKYATASLLLQHILCRTFILIFQGNIKSLHAKNDSERSLVSTDNCYAIKKLLTSSYSLDLCKKIKKQEES